MIGSEAGSEDSAVRRRWRNAFIIVFLGSQLLVPLRGLWFDKFETRGNFSWNMYSQRYSCRASYFVITPDRLVEPIEPRDFFHRPSRVTMAYHRDTLPRLHRFLCERLDTEGRLGSLRGSVDCKLNRGERVELVVENSDICTVPNYGVGER